MFAQQCQQLRVKFIAKVIEAEKGVRALYCFTEVHLATQAHGKTRKNEKNGSDPFNVF